MSIYLGLMLGSSADGIDAALVEFDDTRIVSLAFKTYALSVQLKDQLLALSIDQAGSIQKQWALDVELGHCFAQAARALLAGAHYESSDISAVGVHGYTVLHVPTAQAPTSIQLGDPHVIAAALRCPVVSDFRRADIAAGGQGAPFAPAFHQALWQHDHPDSVIINIGGIANLSAWPQGKLLGFDTGPGNVLMDMWILAHQSLAFDQNGAWGRLGAIDTALFEALKTDPYFNQTAPKSTSRQYFNLAWLNRYLEGQPSTIDVIDVQATLCALTAWSIAQSVIGLDQTTAAVRVCGGGVHNHALMQRLAEYLPGVNIGSTDQIGWSADALEAGAFAWFAKLRMALHPVPLSRVTGATKDCVLGAVTR